MAKELPYFKFYINEWNNGDISLENYKIQGVFLNICIYYWSKDCELTLVNLKKKLRGLDTQIDYLIKSDIIKIDGEYIDILFLNEQFKSKEVQIIANRSNGLKGGRPLKIETETITKIKPNGLIFANPNITNIKESKGKESKEDKSKVNKSKDYKPDVETSSIDYQKFVDKFNSFTGKKYRVTEKVKKALNARLKDYNKKEIMLAIEKAHKDEFHINSKFNFLTPEFILRQDKLEKFLNQTINGSEKNRSVVGAGNTATGREGFGKL